MIPEQEIVLPEKSQKPRINVTANLRYQNAYTLALNGEYSSMAFDEIRSPLNRGFWRSKVFNTALDLPLDLEIGTGSGTHFAHYANQNPNRLVLGMELKYKPLIQTIRRAHKNGSTNVAVTRFHAFDIEQLFVENELNNVLIHFPDPWVSPRKPKNRTVCASFLKTLFKIQRTGSTIEFKTDSLEYFDWALQEVSQTPYQIEFVTYDLHNSEISSYNFETAFEKIFLRQGLKINYVRLRSEK